MLLILQTRLPCTQCFGQEKIFTYQDFMNEIIKCLRFLKHPPKQFCSSNQTGEFSGTVQDLMRGKPPIVETASTSLAEAFMRCRQNDIHRLPVVDDAGNLVGLLSTSDLRLACESPLFHPLEEIQQRMKDKTVADAMHRSVQTCEPTDSVLAAAKLLRVGGVSGLVVLQPESKKVVGVLSRSDILDEFIRHLEPQ